MSRCCLLSRRNDVGLQRAVIGSSHSFGGIRVDGARTSDDKPEIHGVQRPKSFLTQHELVW